MPIAIGLGLSPSLRPMPVRVETEAAALIARFTTPPTATRSAQINALVRYLKSAGVWAKLDALYLIAAADAQAAQRNWVQNAFNLSPVNSPTFTADRGYAGDGATSYLNTGLSPFTVAGAATLNSVSMGGYINAGTDTAATVDLMGARDGNDGFLRPRIAGDLLSGRFYGAANVSPGASTTRYGFSVLERPDASNVAGYKNGVKLSALASATTQVLANTPLYICCSNVLGTPGNFMDNRVAAAFYGAGLGDAGQLVLYNAVLAYLSAVGAA